MFFRSKTNTQSTFAALNSKHNGKLGCLWVVDADQITRFAINSSQESTLRIHKGQQSNDSSPLHSIGEVPLLFSGEASETTRQNFAALSDEFLEQIHILVVDGIARLDRRKALLKEGTRHNSGKLLNEEHLQNHLISL